MSILPYSTQVLLLLLPLSETSANQFQDCATTEHACGTKGYSISYPFLVPRRPSYCGYEGFDLACNGDNSSLSVKIDGKSYDVKAIDYSSQVLTLVVPDLTGGSCPDAAPNVSLGTSLFDFSGLDFNVTFYFNCTVFDFLSYSLTAARCSNGLQLYFRVFIDGPAVFASIPFVCTSVGAFPLNRTAATLLSSGEMSFEDAVQAGFGVKWTAGQGWCTGCVDSGGVCGYDPAGPGNPTCFCPNGTTPLASCKIAADPGPGGHSSKRRMVLIRSLSISMASLLFSCLLFLLYFHRRKRSLKPILFWKKKSENTRKIEALLDNYGSLAPRRYKYSEVMKITKSFREKLGQGGYGSVFKGSLQDGRLVAVKFLSDSKGNGEEFVNEVISISRTSHVNIVSLLGFCLEGHRRALIYEYMPHGSLEKYIYIENPKATLGWEKLYEIAVGVARGLEYLHCGCNTRIVHFDIKPHNILLDQEFSPKISDFGLAKLSSPKDSILSMAGARGTVGFIAPEVFSRSFGVVSTKSDVYSYGMVVLEMVGGRKNVKASVENSSEVYFPHWIYDHLDQDQDLHAWEVTTTETIEIAKKLILVGLWCVQTMPGNRPTMRKVVDMLEGSTNDLQMPPKPRLSSPLHSTIGSSSSPNL